MLVLFLLLFSLCFVASENVAQSIAKQTTFKITASMCTKQFSMKGQHGCAAGVDGTLGSLYLVSSFVEYEQFITLKSKSKYIIVMPPSLLTLERVAELEKLSWFRGIVVLLDQPPSEFSESTTTASPNTFSGYQWNPDGRSLLYNDFSFPIVGVKASEAENIRLKSVHNLNRGYKFPLWSVEITSYMGPSNMRSDSCLDKGSCLPLGGQSIWSVLGGIDSFPTNSTQSPVPQRPLIVVSTRIDSASIFTDAAYGAESTVSSLVALLAAGEALSKIIPNSSSLDYQISFAFFQGESWGQVGSKRFFSEVSHFTCEKEVDAENSPSGQPFCAQPLRPYYGFYSISPDLIHYSLSVDQLGISSEGLFSHSLTDPTDSSLSSNSAVRARRIYNILSSVATSQSLVFRNSDVEGEVPPSAASALSKLDAYQDTGSLVLAGYNSRFLSSFYDSTFDVNQTDSTSVIRAAQLIATSLYALATGIEDPAEAVAAVPTVVQVNSTFVEELLYCFNKNATCALFADTAAIPRDQLGFYHAQGPLPLFCSVYDQPYMYSAHGFVLLPTFLEGFIRNTMITFTSSHTGNCVAPVDCHDLYGKSSECILSKCWYPNAYFHDALSPAISSNEYGSFHVNVSLISDDDPVFTEPYWSGKIGASVFLMNSLSVDVGMFVVGIFTIIGSYLLAKYFIFYLDEHYKVA